MYGRRRRYNHHHGGNFALLLLASQLYQVGFERIPPITLLTILGQVAIFLQLIGLRGGWPSISDICISSDHIIKNYEYKRLITATFFHLNDWHLYYNMVSYLWKGMKLERQYGSPYFAYMLAVFTVLTNIVTVALGVVAAIFLESPSYRYQCAAGFSGVIFALKVLTSHHSQGSEMVFGFPVPGPYVCWAELFIIQIIAPGTSFIGHLAGILVGLMYVKGPLKTAMGLLIPQQPSYTYREGTTRNSTHRQTSYTYQSGTTSGRGGLNSPRDNETSWTRDDTGGLIEEEQLRRAMEESRRTYYERAPSQSQWQTSGPPSAPPPPAPSSTQPSAPPPPSSPPPAPSAPPYVPPDNPPSSDDGARNREEEPDLSLRDSNRPTPNSDTSFYIDADELRRRRLARFNKIKKR